MAGAGTRQRRRSYLSQKSTAAVDTWRLLWQGSLLTQLRQTNTGKWGSAIFSLLGNKWVLRRNPDNHFPECSFPESYIFHLKLFPKKKNFFLDIHLQVFHSHQREDLLVCYPVVFLHGLLGLVVKKQVHGGQHLTHPAPHAKNIHLQDRI